MNWKKRAAQCSIFLSLLATKSAFADSGNWNLTIGGNWDNNTNWAYPNGGAAFPNGTSQVAAFSTVPFVSSTITLANPANAPTISHLVSTPDTSIAGNQLLTIDFGTTPLTFQNLGGSPCSITVVKGNLEIKSPVFVNFSNLMSVTAQTSNVSGQTVTFDKSIICSGRLSLSGSQPSASTFYLQDANVTGDPIELYNSILYLNAASHTPVIGCRGLIINSQSILKTITGNDLFNHNSAIQIYGGAWNIENILSEQHTIGHLIIYGTPGIPFLGGVSENGVVGSLTITNTSMPACSSFTRPIIIGAGGFIAISELFLPNGGNITYDPSYQGTGTFSGAGTSSGIMNIDLGTNVVVLDVPSGGNIDYDLNFFDVQFSNGVLFKDGSGIVLFEGTQGVLAPLTLYDGTVTIGRNASDVVNTGGGITLFAPSLLNGFGTLGVGAANVINERGTVNPGNPTTIGKLTIRGNYSQQANGNLLIKGLNAAQTDQLVVSIGKATLDGTLTFQALPGASYLEGESVVILDSSAGEPISGRFSSFQSNLPSCLQASLQYDPNQVLLLFSACNTPPVPFRTLPSHYINLAIPVFNLANGRMIALQNRLEYVRSRLSNPQKHKEDIALLADAGEGFLLSSPKAQPEKNMEETPPPVITASRFRKTQKNHPLSVYVAPLGSLGGVDGISRQRGFSFHSLGGVLGLDYAWSRVGLGGSLTYERLHGHVDHNWGHFSLQTVLGKLYTTFLPVKNRHFFVDAALDVGHNLYHIHRSTTSAAAKGKTHGWQGDGFLGIGYDFLWTHLRATPLASIQFNYLNISHYQENGPFGLATKVEDQSSRSTRTSLGGSLGGNWKTGCVTWLPELRAAWQYELTPQKHTLSISSVDFNNVTQISLFGGDHIYVTGGAALRALIGKRWSALGSYDYYWNSDARTQLFYLELSCAF